MSEITLQEQIEAVEWEVRGVLVGLASHIDPELAMIHCERLKAAAATLRELQKRRTPYSEFCRHPDKCEGLGCCPSDPTCAD